MIHFSNEKEFDVFLIKQEQSDRFCYLYGIS
jgi:hypothetical protein